MPLPVAPCQPPSLGCRIHPPAPRGLSVPSCGPLRWLCCVLVKCLTLVFRCNPDCVCWGSSSLPRGGGKTGLVLPVLTGNLSPNSEQICVPEQDTHRVRPYSRCNMLYIPPCVSPGFPLLTLGVLLIS